MSYLRKIGYEIIPNESFSVIRNCSGCGRKTHFNNTKKFRINANGNKLDVWLIYQCGQCRHTFNLEIYARQKNSAIQKNEYARFLSNDGQLAEMYGKNIQLFKKNKAEVDFERLDCQFVKQEDTAEEGGCGQSDCSRQNCGEEDCSRQENGQRIVITIHNPYQLKIRPEKQIAGVLGLSRSQVKRKMREGEIELETVAPQFISVCVKHYIYQDGGKPDEDRDGTPDYNGI